MRILIVEDNAVLALLIQDTLLEAGHTIVGNVASQSEAIALLERGDPELVLLDLRLAEGSGTAFLRHVARRREVSCLLISADSGAARDLAGHCLGVLHKPFDMPTLVNAITAVESFIRDDPGKAPVPRELELFARPPAAVKR